MKYSSLALQNHPIPRKGSFRYPKAMVIIMKGMEYDGESFSSIRLINERIEDCDFTDCEFTDCIFEECKLFKTTFSDCRFVECSFVNPKAEYSQMKYSQFTKCSLSGVNWLELLPSGRIAEPFDKFSGCMLKYNTFANMRLNRFDFSGNEIIRSMFADCELADSIFKGCLLSETEFYKCDIRNADFRDAAGYKINIMENKLKGGKFSYPDVLSLLDVLGIKIE